MAILGRPNVGKSSLLNAILGEDRVIVSDVPGTTRDTIDTVLKRGETTFVLVDTAGLRRKRKQRQGIEYYSELRALDAVDRADVALVLIDASEGLVDGTCRSPTSRARRTARRSSYSRNGTSARRRSRMFGRGSPSACASAPASSRSPPRRAAASHVCSTVSTALRQAHVPHPDAGAQQLPPGAPRGPSGAVEVRQPAAQPPLRVQTTVRPPRFRFFVNDPGLVTRDYGYWVENQLRERFELEGVPVSIDSSDAPSTGGP